MSLWYQSSFLWKTFKYKKARWENPKLYITLYSITWELSHFEWAFRYIFPKWKSYVRIGRKVWIKNQILQILELDADYCAVRSLVYLLDEKYHFEDWADREFLLAGFSLYYIFLIFQEKNYENIQSIGDYLNDFTLHQQA